MPYAEPCPRCGKKLRVPDEADGKRIRCPNCEAYLAVGRDGLEPLGNRDSEPARRRDDDEDNPRRGNKRAHEDDDYDESRSRRPRARKGARRGIPIWVWVVGGVVLGGGGFVLLLVFTTGGHNFDKVKEGMTREQVCSTLGLPVKSVGGEFEAHFHPPLKEGEVMTPEKRDAVTDLLLIWYRPDGKVVVKVLYFDERALDEGKASDYLGGRRPKGQR